MKKILFLAVSMTLSIHAFSQESNPKYDAALAKSLGADEYGMKSYVLVILKTGPAVIEDKAKLNMLFRGHMDNINRLAKAGKLVVAGPLGDNPQQYRGIFIFNVKTLDEAKALLVTDPTVKEKVFETELFEWYGSAALPEYLKVHEKIEKVKH